MTTSSKILAAVAVHLNTALQQADTEVSIYSVDVPHNNWKVLFSNVAEGYAASPGVYAFAKAGNFYERCFPADFLDLVYSGRL